MLRKSTLGERNGRVVEDDDALHRVRHCQRSVVAWHARVAPVCLRGMLPRWCAVGDLAVYLHPMPAV
jgi:hypothetical protein